MKFLWVGWGARLEHTVFGRPMRAAHRDRILELKAQGQSLRQIAANLSVGYGSDLKGQDEFPANPKL